MTYSGTATVQYFDRDQFVGERRMWCCSASMGSQSFSAYWPHTAMFCPNCGTLWGRAIYQYQFDYQPHVQHPWTIEVRRCAECGDGTFLAAYNHSDHLDTCTPQLLQREALLLLLKEPA